MRKISLKRRLFYAFIITSVIPVIIFGFFSYYNSANIVKENMDELKTTNLQQTRESLNICLESYEDLLYQIYTDDDIIALINKLNTEEDTTVAVNQLCRTLRGLLNSKDYIRALTIYTANGSMVTYNQLTAASTGNSWMENSSMTQDEMYEIVSADNKTHIFDTEYSASFAGEEYYLFRMAHRFINYKKLEERSAIIVMGLDEELLQNICQSNTDEREELNSINFIVGDDGSVISYVESDKIGKKLFEGEIPSVDKKKLYEQLVVNTNLFESKNNSIYECHDDELSWNIVNVSNQSRIMEKLRIQRDLLTAVLLFSLLIITGIIIFLTEQLISSIQRVVLAMNQVGQGTLDVRVKVDNTMPLEIETIATEFNQTLERLQRANEKEREAGEKQKNAEIKALEAQINPHFLYNTLDTINWMAIEKEEYEVSNAISALATILRYAIDNSNGIVTLWDEAEWLKKYIFLQQTRLKNTFSCDIHVEPELYTKKIHKLLLQPFVENAILHGFEGTKKSHELQISMTAKEDVIEITITDNGKGISEEILEKINHEIFGLSNEKNHIGLENAITRIRMYYGDKAKVRIYSKLEEGTQVVITIPEGEGE